MTKKILLLGVLMIMAFSLGAFGGKENYNGKDVIVGDLA